MLQKPKMDLRDSYTFGLLVWKYIIDQRRVERSAPNVVHLGAANVFDEIMAVSKETSPEEFARHALEYLDSVRGTPGWILPTRQQIEALSVLKSPNKHN